MRRSFGAGPLRRWPSVSRGERHAFLGQRLHLSLGSVEGRREYTDAVGGARPGNAQRCPVRTARRRTFGGLAAAASLVSLDDVIRLAAGLGLFALAAFAYALFVPSGFDVSSIDPAIRSILLDVAVGAGAVVLTAVLVATYVRFRLSRITHAIERISRGDRDVTVEGGVIGLDGGLASAVTELAKQLSTTRESASVDRLTGVANRQTLLAGLFAEVERANRHGRPFSVAFVDIDHFKQVNDTYGHAAGDVVLRGVAQAVSSNLRQNDLVGRYGGEEFMIILPETGIEDAAALSEKLRHVVGRLTFAVDGNPSLAVTISIGVAGGLGRSMRVEDLVRDADAAMYSAKALGRNQTYVFAEPDEDARVPRAPISPQGRQRAEEIGRIARDAAAAALTQVIEPLPNHRGRPSPLIEEIAVRLAMQLDLPEQEVDRIRIAALLHDIGKVALPPEILEKPGPLTSAEWRTVVQHPRIGQVILEQATLLREAVPIILHHHERYSGHGYPFGLRANDIPVGARIVAIADAYDAMTHDRPYKRAMSHERAIKELRRQAGTQFDPELVALFCELYGAAAPSVEDDQAGEGAGAGPLEEPVALPSGGEVVPLPRRAEVVALPSGAEVATRLDAFEKRVGLLPAGRHAVDGAEQDPPHGMPPGHVDDEHPIGPTLVEPVPLRAARRRRSTPSGEPGGRGPGSGRRRGNAMRPADPATGAEVPISDTTPGDEPTGEFAAG